MAKEHEAFAEVIEKNNNNSTLIT